jgi:hypothetical protein
MKVTARVDTDRLRAALLRMSDRLIADFARELEAQLTATDPATRRAALDRAVRRRGGGSASPSPRASPRAR